MSIKFNVSGSKRTALAKEIGRWLGMEVSYAGVPSFAYNIGESTLDRTGALTVIGIAADTLERLLQHLYDEEYEFESDAPALAAEECDSQEAEALEEGQPETTAAVDPTIDQVTIHMPRAIFTDAAMENLHRMIEAKGYLIKKALGISELPITQSDDCVDFPWIPSGATPEEIKAYILFVSAICDMAIHQTRINAKEKQADNEKYAFRCFLLRLGFIGAEYKAERKILLRNLTGSSAFKSGMKGGAEA